MYSLKIENTNGEIFELTHDFSNYYVTDVSGLTPPATTINTAKAGIIDGTFFNSASVEERNIVISLTINGDIEANRQKLYRIFPRKTACTVYFKNANRDVKIQGYVETIESDLFSKREKAQISIICPRPYFEDLATIYAELAATLSMFEFPFA
ncbi:MAG: phage tail family protein, partial [Clostridiales bacterium]|nr:phage tail family protein [Clostridiales bacterium]